MTTDWWQQQHVRQAIARQDMATAGDVNRPCGCLIDPVVFGHYWCGRP